MFAPEAKDDDYPFAIAPAPTTNLFLRGGHVALPVALSEAVIVCTLTICLVRVLLLRAYSSVG